ncbi:MAG TPA: glycosyltransferase family 9 protein [Candidatus Binataceae bacterium]|jgi:ADP-heptose:LPS heptosyltransferase|nr:glycosyltransferase family 9 protein [Candidatus Binataceae bacterium]
MRSILVIFPGALGDLVCLIPALRVLARQHPGASVELMARAELARFATGRLLGGGDRSDGSSRGHSIDRRELAQLFAAGRGPVAAEAQAFFGLFEHVYSFFAADDEHFRAALDTASGGRASYFSFRPPGSGHIAAAYLREIGAENPEAILGYSIELYREDMDLAEDRLAGLGLEAGHFVLIFPGSGSPAKNWPAENYASLTTMLIERMRPLVILGPAEAALRPIFTAQAGLPVLTHLELAEVAALARLAAGFVGNDSGVSHLAAAAGAPGVVLFGPTDPARWRPLGDTTVIRQEPLNSITPAAVAAALSELISIRKSA